MRIFGRILLMLVLLIVIISSAGILYLNTAFPKDFSVEKLDIPTDSVRISHGNYLVNHVMMCTDCHSTRDMSFYSGPVSIEHLGNGGKPFSEEMGFPGELYPENLTPIGISGWTNEELYKAIVGGIHKDGHALFPIMPYMNYRTLDKADILDVIAYLRTLNPSPTLIEPKERKLNFPLNLIVKTMPAAPNHQTKPSISDTIAYGHYMITAASCIDCHTPQVNGQPDFSREFGGGMEFMMENGRVCVSANITPDSLTGIGKWSQEDFIKKFKKYAAELPKVDDHEFNTEMPWSSYAGMKEQDLKAIYAYLRTVKPVNQAIVKFR